MKTPRDVVRPTLKKDMLQENISLLSLFDSNSFGDYVNLSFNLAQCHDIVNGLANENGEFPVQIAVNTNVSPARQAL